MARQTDREMRGTLVGQARLVAQAVNLEDIKSLSGTASDLGTPLYLRLKQQFADLKAVDPRCRHLYVMGRLPDGRVFFYVDSRQPGSVDESPAGKIRTEISPQHLQAFTKKTAMAAGPVTDRGGKWITALAPLSDPRSGEVIAVLGMEIHAGTWMRDLIARAVLPPALLTLAMIAVLLTGRVLSTRQAYRTGRSCRGQWRIEPGLACAVGLILTMTATWTLDNHDTWSRRRSFFRMASGRTNAIVETLRHLRDQQLESLARFYEGSVEADAAKFRQFTGHLTRTAAVQAWAWVPAVPAAERDRFEDSARAEGMRGFWIWEMDAQGRKVPAAERDVYYPLFRIAPRAGNEPALGLDLGSVPLKRSALTEAERTKLPTATDPITLVQDRECHQGMLFVRPVFQLGGGHGPVGFALAAVRPSALLECAETDASLLLDLVLIERGGLSATLAGSPAMNTQDAGDLSLTRPLLALGKVFAVQASAGPGFAQLYPRRAGLAASLTGLLLTAAIVAVIAVAQRRRGELERLVSDRTARLLENEKQLDLLMSQSLDGFFFMMLDEPIVWNDGIDKDETLEHVFRRQRMTRVNQAMLDQYGAREQDFIGLTPHDLFQHDLDHGYEIWRGLFDRGRWHVETDGRRLDGSTIRVCGDYICLRDTEGRIIGHFGVQADITARKTEFEDLVLTPGQ